MQISEKPRILMLSTAKEQATSSLNDVFVQHINKQWAESYELTWCHYDDIVIEFETGKIRATLRADGLELKEFVFLLFKSFIKNSEQATAIAEYLQQEGVRFMCSELKHYLPFTKLTQMARLARANLPIPKTFFTATDRFVGAYDIVIEKLGTPFIFKVIDGKGGASNFLVSNREQLQEIVASHASQSFLAQSFIENSSDLRVLIVNKQIELIIKRTRQSDETHLNNTSQGAAAELMPLADLALEQQELALKAAEVMDREIAGVDLMFETGTEQPYILEVNASPQIASGAFLDDKLRVYGNFFNNMLK